MSVPEYRELPDDYAMQLGRLSTHWSFLDDLTRDAISALAHLDLLTGIAVLAHLGIRERLGALISLALLQEPLGSTISSEMRAVAGVVENDLLLERNALIHWGYRVAPDGSVSQMRIQTKGGIFSKPDGHGDMKPKIHPVPRTSADVSALIDKIDSATRTLIKLTNRLGAGRLDPLVWLWLPSRDRST